jgi:serine/threonine-protein kinase
MEDVFVVQDEIAATIAGRLRLSLAADRESALTPPTRNLGAYELYLRGRVLLYRRGASIPKALACFSEAVGLDPAYAQAWAGLADGYTTAGYSGFQPGTEVMPRALEAARRGLELDPDLAEAHNALACAMMLYDRDYAGAEKEFRRALELNPRYLQARAWYGLFFLHWVAGREAEAREQIALLLEVDPRSAYAQVVVACCDFASRRPEGVTHARRGVELDPQSYLAHYILTLCLLHEGRLAEAAAAVEPALAMSERHPWALSSLVSIHAAGGRLEEARAAFAELQARSTHAYVQPSVLGTAAAGLGDRDQAVAFAQRALTERDPFFVMMARTWPSWDPVRTDPRFRDVMRRLALPGGDDGS